MKMWKTIEEFACDLRNGFANSSRLPDPWVAVARLAVRIAPSVGDNRALVTVEALRAARADCEAVINRLRKCGVPR